MSRPLKEHYPSSAAIIRVECVDLAGLVLEHMHTLSPNLLRQASSHNLANHISQSYESFNQKIYEMLFSACEWLIKHDFLKEVDSQRHFTFTEKGRRLKTLIEFKDFLSEEKSESALSPNQITSNAQNNQTRTLSVFLCHSSGDKPAVRDLYDRMRSAADYISPWLDEEDLLPGQRWQDEIPRVVRGSDVVVACLSQNSINKKGYVQKEIKYALDVADEQPEGTIFLIPVRLEDCEIPERLKHLHCVNLNESRGFEQLVRALNVRAEKLGIVGGASSIKHDLIDEKSEQSRVTQLRQELLASYPGDRQKAARQLGQLGPTASSAVPTLIKKLKDSSGPVRDAAAWALREIGTEQALDAVARYENK